MRFLITGTDTSGSITLRRETAAAALRKAAELRRTDTDIRQIGSTDFQRLTPLVVRRRDDPQRIDNLPIRRCRGSMAHARRPQKITLGEMRSSGVRGLLVYCAARCNANGGTSASHAR